MEPDISNPDDLYKMLTVLSNAGGVTPDFAHEMICDVTGKPSENYTEEWGKVPVAVSKIKAQGSGMDLDFDGMIQQLSGQIQKASKNRESDELVAVMKEVRRVLSDIQKQK